MEITFKVEHQKISRIDNNEIIAGSRNYLRAKFVFMSDEWQGVKTAIFTYKGMPIKMILDNNDECDVPWEVIDETCFSVSVFCGNLVTANWVIVPVRKTGYVGIGESNQPTPDIYNQIIMKLNELQVGSVDADTVKAVVDEYLKDNSTESTVDEEYVIEILKTSGYATENYVSTAIEAAQLSGGSGGSSTTVTKTGTVEFYNATSFEDSTYTITPTGTAYVASRNFLKIVGALNGYTGASYSLVEGTAVNVLGVDITLNADGTVTLNGTATSAFYLTTNLLDSFREAIIGKNAKVSFSKSADTEIHFNTGLAFNDLSYTYNFEAAGSFAGLVTANKTTGASKFVINSGTVFDNLVISAMLELENDKGYLSEYTASDCVTIDTIKTFAISAYPYVGVVGEHTIEYMVSGSSISASTLEALETIETLKNANPLYEKKVTCVGDSLCYGQGFEGGYCTVLAELEPNTTFINKGVGGSQIASNHASGGNWWIQNQLSGVADDSEYIVCEGYVNDYLTSCELGEITEGYTAELDTTKFYGGMESLCKTLANNYTDRRYGFLILHSQYNSTSAYDNKLYLDAIKECCDKWGVPYLDLSAIITPIVPIYNSTYYSDGLHYNEAGYRKIAPTIREWIKTL